MIYHACKEAEIAATIDKWLSSQGYIVKLKTPEVRGAPPIKQLKYWEFQKLKSEYDRFFENKVIPEYEQLGSNGILLIIISDNLYNADWEAYIASKSIRWFEQQNEWDKLHVYARYYDPPSNGICWSEDSNCEDKIVQEIRRISCE